MIDNMTDKIHACPNCGAEVRSSDTKCPFCGYINEEGAEKAYMDRLNDLKDDLDVVDEAAAEEYGRGYGKVFKLILITLAVLLVISGIVYACMIAKKNSRAEAEKTYGNNKLEEMTWKKEAFKEFDRLYEAGDYDKLCEVMYDAYEKHPIVFDWDHFWLVSTYNDYLSTIEDLERVDKEGWHKYEAESVFYRCCFIYYCNDVYKYGDPDNRLTDEEIERLQPVIAYMNGVLHDRLGFTDEDMEELKGRLVGDHNNLKYDECTQIAIERMEQFR